MRALGQAGQQGCASESASHGGRPASEGCGCGCDCGCDCGCGCALLAADLSGLVAIALGRARGHRCSGCTCQLAKIAKPVLYVHAPSRSGGLVAGGGGAVRELERQARLANKTALDAENL